MLAFSLVFVKGKFSPIDPVVGTWAGNDGAGESIILNQNGTGFAVFLTETGMKTFFPVWKSVGNNSYYLDYPRQAVLSPDNLTLTFADNQSFTGNGFVGPWKGTGEQAQAQGLAAEELLYIFPNNTGFYYLKAAKNPVSSQVMAFSWKQLDDGSYSFYDYSIGMLFALSDDAKTQTYLKTGSKYSGNGLAGIWSRAEPYTAGDGTRVNIQRVFNEDGTAKQFMYKMDGTIHSVRHMTWFRLIDGYYCVVIDDLPLGKAVLNDDGTLTYNDYCTFTPDTVFHKI